MTSTPRGDASVSKFVLAIHGGLAPAREKLSADGERDVREALRESLLAGFQVLQADPAGCVDAVIASVQLMEDSPHFNAGKGSVYTQAGTIELDAAIMEGKARRAGAVAAIGRVRNPILAARAVMMQSPAVFLVGDAADRFAESVGLQMADPTYFFTERRWRDYLAWKERQQGGGAMQVRPTSPEISRGTVGAVALDRQGNLAAATSTGGVSFKLPGRVGDSGVIGAGTFADNRTCAVSATGDGELFIRSVAAYSVSARMLYGNQSVVDAAQAAVNDVGSLGGKGGLIAIDFRGNLAMPFHADGMYRGSMDERGNMEVALYEN
jgi:beta-aspartyl-peptidase (threonine type)